MDSSNIRCERIDGPPSVGTAECETQGNKSKTLWRMSGWKVGALTAACTAAFVLFINIGVTLSILRRASFSDGLATIFTGDCEKVGKFNIWIHLGINILSTLLLSGSNYCMQCLSAPTRAEVDSAHEKRRWLDIGVPSVRNLGNIAPKRVFLWLCLGLSSVPLHLLYNSAFFTTLSTNEYNVLYATESFATGSSYNTEAFPDQPMSNFSDIQKHASTFERLENRACIQAYAQELVTARSNVIVVVENSTSQGIPAAYVSTFDNSSLQDVDWSGFPVIPLRDVSYPWICDPTYLGSKFPEAGDPFSRGCFYYVPDILKGADEWVSHGYKVKYCLSQEVEGLCSLTFSRTIIIAVIICNLGKLIITSIVAFCIRDKPLITVGDAIDSFLVQKDRTTEGMCLATKDIIKKTRWASTSAPMEYNSKSVRWFHAASKTRWLICITMFVVALGAVLGLTLFGITLLQLKHDIKTLWSLGLGTVDPHTVMTGMLLNSVGGSRLVSLALIANTPQPVLSVIYLVFNSICTAMLLSDEWSHFSAERKPLRVSNPKQAQRSTYFLQLPYRFALPLMAMSGILHWLVSQSIFLANISIRDRNGDINTDDTVSTCGYSLIAMIFVLITGGCLLSFGIALGFRRFKPGMPFVGSCSAAISAACHRPPEEVDSALLPVQWGALPGFERNGVGHCCFSNGDVEEPIPGQLYAGRVSQDDAHASVLSLRILQSPL